MTTATPTWLDIAIEEQRRAVRTFTQTGTIGDYGKDQTPTYGPLEPTTQTCTCHCWHNHPQQSGICNAASTPGTTIHDEPACRPCHNAHQP